MNSPGLFLDPEYYQLSYWYHDHLSTFAKKSHHAYECRSQILASIGWYFSNRTLYILPENSQYCDCLILILGTKTNDLVVKTQ